MNDPEYPLIHKASLVQVEFVYRTNPVVLDSFTLWKRVDSDEGFQLWEHASSTDYPKHVRLRALALAAVDESLRYH